MECTVSWAPDDDARRDRHADLQPRRRRSQDPAHPPPRRRRHRRADVHRLALPPAPPRIRRPRLDRRRRRHRRLLPHPAQDQRRDRVRLSAAAGAETAGERAGGRVLGDRSSHLGSLEFPRHFGRFPRRATRFPPTFRGFPPTFRGFPRRVGSFPRNTDDLPRPFPSTS